MHRVKKRSKGVSTTHDSIGSQSLIAVGVDDIQDPSKVTKGRPKSKRLGTALEKSFKKSARSKNKKVALVYDCVNLTLDDYFCILPCKSLTGVISVLCTRLFAWIDLEI
ncbi:hypothetical protein AHAS_Ahas04G0123300 [Arachis hypogaea]